MEAWEQFHGRIFDTNRNEALRVQVVLDPDETWLLQVGDQSLEGNQESMKTVSIPEPEPSIATPSAATTQDLGVRAKAGNKAAPSTRVISSIPLIQRLGLSGQSNGLVALGSHLVGVAPSVSNTRPVATPTSASSRGKAKKGPARLTRAGKKTRLTNSSTDLVSVGGAAQRRQQRTAQDLDTDMDQYRLSGRMGLDSARLH